MARQRTPRTSTRGGAATVEFALVAPILILFFFAAIEFARIDSIRHTVENASYEGARRALIVGGNADEAKKQAEDMLASLGLVNGTVEVSPSTILPTTPQVSVHVSVPFNKNDYGVAQFFTDMEIGSTTVLDREWHGEDVE